MDIISWAKELKDKLCQTVDLFVLQVSRLFPIDKKLICLESEGDCSDNAYAFFNYVQNKLNDKYKVIWFVDHPENFRNGRNVVYVRKQWKNQNWRRNYYLARCSFYIYDHNNLLKDYFKRIGQTIIYLGHGYAFKAPKGGVTKTMITGPDEVISISQLGEKSDREWLRIENLKTVILGYPRNDYLFEKSAYVKGVIEKKYQISRYDKVFLWMPTFRQSNAKNISEDYLKNETGLPMFGSIDGLETLNRYLADNNAVIYLKLHHLQAELPIFNRCFSNIAVIRDSDLQSMGIQLYQFVSFSDALITDYSSISVDYMLLDNPIIYTLDDIDEYRKSRGLRDSSLEHMPGYHVYNPTQLIGAMGEVINNQDRYAIERTCISKEFHYYRDGNSAHRIASHLGLEKEEKQ